MREVIFDGSLLDTADLIALDCIMGDLPKEDKDRFIKEYKEDEPEEWAEYLEHRKNMGYPEL